MKNPKKLILSTENSATYITPSQEGSHSLPYPNSPDHSIRLGGFAKVFFWLVMIGVHIVAYTGFIY